MNLRLTILFLLINSGIFSQASQPPATLSSDRDKAYSIRTQMLENSVLKDMPVRSIGPTVFSGRISDIEVNPNDPTQFYAAYASGGLWFSDNNGTSFEPLFQDQAVMTIGDVAVDWDNNVIWLGSGEVNSSRSSYAGDGMYRSNDGGKTWTHHGLEESHHIGRVLIHPENPDIVWVAALGHLYSPNTERGIFKTVDGGKSWNKVLYVDENSGGIDLIFDPMDSNTMYAAMWDRKRRAWDFTESGAGSGIYKSSNGGESWSQLNTPESGFPYNEGVGRIGLDAGIKDGKSVLYAVLDNYNRRPDEEKDEDEGLVKNDFKGMSKESFLKIDQNDLKDFLRSNRFPRKYNAKSVMAMVKSDKIKPDAIAEYLEDANSLLFDTPVIGAEVYISTDGGVKWTRTHEDFLDGVFNSYGYYFATLRLDKKNPNFVYIMGVPILKSEDAGKTWKNINGDNQHVDHHALWVNPDRKGHLINGNDGGINISYDFGEHWTKCNSIPVGQFYHIEVDMAKPYNVYGGLQDNGVWMGPSTYTESTRWHGTGQYPYEAIMGGDGMQVQVDKRDNETVYTGFQFGNYFRINTSSGARKSITPRHELGDRPYRWNWQSPILLSKHNSDIVYFGSNKLMRSMDKGDNFLAISDDLTSGGRKGDVAYGTISTIDESPSKFGLLYVGTDDGHIHVSHDGGNNWKNVSMTLPKNMWVSRVIASSHAQDRVYAVLNGFRWDDFNPYLYVSEDNGSSWTKLSNSLPMEPLNVVKEDLENENILYVGSDHGTYISADRGESFMVLGNIPHAPVHDLVVHPRDGELIIGTHGRSLFATDIKPFRELVAKGIEDTPLMVFSVKDQRSNNNWGRIFSQFRDPFEPSIDIIVHSALGGEGKMTVTTGEDIVLFETSLEMKKGLAPYTYKLTVDDNQVEAYTTFLNDDSKEVIKMKKADTGKFYLKKGEYKITFSQGDESSSTKLKVE